MMMMIRVVWHKWEVEEEEKKVVEEKQRKEERVVEERVVGKVKDVENVKNKN